MKKFLASTLGICFILSLSSPAESRNYKETEDIIKSILQQSPVKEKKSSTAPSDKSSDDTNAPDRDDGEKGSSVSADEVMLKNGIDLFNSGLFEHSRKAFDELISKSPSSPFVDAARIWRSRISLRENLYQDVLKDLDQIKDTSGEYPAARFLAAQCQLALGQKIEALKTYRAIAFQFPGHELADNALLQAGRLYLATGRGDRAIEAFIKMVKSYRDRETIDDAFFYLGQTFEKDPGMRDIETAREIYRIFLDKSEKGELHFKNSPLKARVRNDLRHLERIHFRMER